ncbi:exopolysaccharide biosynthesis polyprenyl glycosylphosphotransferase [Winogradskyella immobilis]|uniref:Exopolysaccharide biosynthesis polyprenyl glycosylphosphotransferase n=1 Tax=Winogradskyella immobilis TaxID=2816852 RepID=A0ABS8EJX3_9FLAO|nr:exopolysaccharide biosynthesis polyprenyl glycosylphosphotransferase [Winogradskyella immobilis]MCC1483496.1 exopolysaccharide biosynthesis polyprenyl glycosylphosphotransferase [Winogradskyella immobilis]MCG0015590.1 exopolysaccharide biosynthesis polyprenyl glycosylphosphotransferase [Winogradskyella immobilis]
MSYIRGRYSWVLRPALIVFDILTLNVFASHYIDFQTYDDPYWSLEFLMSKATFFIMYVSILWLISAYSIKFYNVYRYTSALNILILVIKQFFIFSVIIFAFIGFNRDIEIETMAITKYLFTTIGAITLVKFIMYYGLKKFRQYLNGNLRRILVIGNTSSAQELVGFFNKKREYGYDLLGVYSDSTKGKQLDGSVKEAITYLSENEGVDEIYCAMDELSEKQINTFVKHAELNRYNIKFIPEAKTLFDKHLKTDFYNYLPVLSIQQVVLNKPFNQLLKRVFDIILSLFVIIFLLSWLTVLLYILIKLESKGPLFYKHRRNGINYKEFECYKFRSLKVEVNNGEDYVKQNDERVTKIGRFLRRTSIDELPQFYNVLFGDMSVVGPRPHMLSYTDAYSKKVDKYNFIYRHNVKPGITGLAQTKGFRGEIKSDDDIVNRVKYDIFYIENWSLLLDLKIIGSTILLVFLGDENAY